jgi:uncharacterized protein (DUF433 family)
LCSKTRPNAKPENVAGKPFGQVVYLENLYIWNMYRVKDYINIDKEILSGNPVFRGTRVPIQTLFDHLEKGIPLGEFLDDFPSVKKEQAIAVIEIASKILTSKNIEQIYETAA